MLEKPRLSPPLRIHEIMSYQALRALRIFHPSGVIRRAELKCSLLVNGGPSRASTRVYLTVVACLRSCTKQAFWDAFVRHMTQAWSPFRWLVMDLSLATPACLNTVHVIRRRAAPAVTSGLPLITTGLNLLYWIAWRDWSLDSMQARQTIPRINLKEISAWHSKIVSSLLARFFIAPIAPLEI